MHFLKTRELLARLTHSLVLAAFLFSATFGVLPTGQALAADDDLINMIVELVKGSDRDMRALALQQIREEIPGEAATMRFVELLPTLPQDLQVEMLDALGERGDAVARPGVLKMLNSKTDAVRAMAARALSGLATPADIPVLYVLSEERIHPLVEPADATAAAEDAHELEELEC